MKFVTEEVRMAQHRFDTPIEGRVTDVEKILNKFIKKSFKKQKDSENLIWMIRKSYDHDFKAQASSIKKLEVQLGRIAEIVQNRETGSLHSFTETNPKALAHAITTRSGLNYKPPTNPFVNNKDSNDAQKNAGEDDRKSQGIRRTKKGEALEQMPKYAKFMKDLPTNKEKFEETSKVTLNERCSAVLLNEIPLKEKVPRSFTIPCAIGKVGIHKSLADLGARISLMPYLMFVRLKLDWNLDFELMCDASDYAVGSVCKVEALLQEFTIKIKDEKGTENLAADHLSRLEIPDLEELDEEAI
ncbi:hypothetical protein Tco_1270769 [Tanacetum coccineum]